MGIIKLQARCHVSRKWNDYMEWKPGKFEPIEQCINSAKLEMGCCDHSADLRILKITTEVLEESKESECSH